MIHWLILLFVIVPTGMYGMEKGSKTLSFYETYHKKRFVEEALENGLPTKKRGISPAVLTTFAAAVDQRDIAGARQILTENNYQPKRLNLAEAVRNDELPDMIYWLGAGRNQNAQEDSFPDALIAATAYGNDFLIRLLLHAGADVNGPNVTGWTPLHFAVWHGRTTAMMLLLDNGADTSALNKIVHTPLYNITRYYNLDRPVPHQWVKDFTTKYICCAQFNPHKTLEVVRAHKQSVMAFLMALNSKSFKLPRDIRHKILSYNPEIIFSLPLFRLLFSHVEHNTNALHQFIEECPFAWFKTLVAAKDRPQERQQLIARLAPLMAAYRIRKLPELLPSLEDAQLMYPGTHGPKSMVKKCIRRAKKDNLILKTVIDALCEVSP